MFIGRYYHTIEEKGRVSLPSKFREVTPNWVITRGLDGGLFIFTREAFTSELDQLNQHPFTKQANRDFLRLMANDAQEVDLDAQGRILLPEFLRAAAQLARDVVIVGSGQRIELWDTKRYHEYLDRVESHAEEIAEKVEL